MLIRFLRYGLPAVLVVAGFVILVTTEGSLRWDGWAMCVGSGLAIGVPTGTGAGVTIGAGWAGAPRPKTATAAIDPATIRPARRTMRAEP